MSRPLWERAVSKVNGLQSHSLSAVGHAHISLLKPLQQGSSGSSHAAT